MINFLEFSLNICHDYSLESPRHNIMEKMEEISFITSVSILFI